MRSAHGKATVHRTPTGASSQQGGFAFEADDSKPTATIAASPDTTHGQDNASGDTGLVEAEILVRCQFCAHVDTHKYPDHEKVGLCACTKDFERNVFGYFRGMQAPHVCKDYQEADL
jgi:hypothetical protein